MKTDISQHPTGTLPGAGKVLQHSANTLRRTKISEENAEDKEKEEEEPEGEEDKRGEEVAAPGKGVTQ